VTPVTLPAKTTEFLTPAGTVLDRLDRLIAQLAPDTLLKALEPPQLQTLLRSARHRDLAPGEVILTQGDANGDFAVCLLEGGLKVSIVTSGGREIILNYCNPGELVGEIAMLDSGPRTATVSAVVDSSVLLIPSHAFIAALLANPDSMIEVMRALALRVRQANQVIESDRTFSMARRLARALVTLRDPERADGRLRFNPSQSDIGAFAGLARENVSRLLSEWEAEGVIERKGRTLFVCDPGYLEGLAEAGNDGG
jgi:CRP/FNR family transcriptional regulator, cyclic AMP receptor protein